MLIFKLSIQYSPILYIRIHQLTKSKLVLNINFKFADILKFINN